MKKTKFLVFSIPSILALFAGGWVFKHFSEQDHQTSIGYLNEIQDSLIFVATGDAMMHLPQLKMATDPLTGTIRFDSCFSLIRPLVKSAHLAMVNFETTLGGEPYSGFPRFSAPIEFADAIRRTGFNIFVYANNHACDKGKVGLDGNINYAESNRLYYAGIYKSSEERNKKYPLIIPFRQWKIAILNYTYGTNKINPPAGYVVNYIDTFQILNDIIKAKQANPALIICAIHWGEEYQIQPNENQKQIAAFLLKHGVNIIIGSHPHVIQPVEFFIPPGDMEKHLVAWSMGNFISNQKSIYTDGAMLLFATIYFYPNNQAKIGKVQVLPLWRFKNKIPPGYYLIPSFADSNQLNQYGFTYEDKKTFYHVIEYIRRQTLTENISEYTHEGN
ncbi:MAG: CapA family protein [Bacteroidales bacterium]|nr:CapA family protein [Bacteroidales bacterium]